MPDDDRSNPATKGDLAPLDSRFDSRLQATESRLDVGMESLENHLMEALGDAQTEVLRAFEGYSAGE